MDTLMVDVSEIKVNYKSKYKTVNRLSEGLAAVQHSRTGLWGFIDIEGNEIIPCQYSYANAFHEGRSLVKSIKADLCGYIDKTGNLVIPCRYKNAKSFYNGVAAVYTDCGWGYIDKNGNIEISCKYEFASDFSEGLAIVKPSFSYYGAVDKKGNKILPYAFTELGNFSEGSAFASFPDGYVYIDREANIGLPHIKYQKCSAFREEMASVKDETGKWGFIDRKGNQVIPCQYEYASDFSEGLAAVQDPVTGLWGFVDKTGNLAIPYQYDYAIDFHGGLAAVEDTESYLWGYIDKTGKLVIPYKYTRFTDFSGGLATVCNEENGSSAFLNKQGIEKPIGIPCYYRKINICGQVIIELEANNEKEIIEQTQTILSKLKVLIEYNIEKDNPTTNAKVKKITN